MHKHSFFCIGGSKEGDNYACDIKAVSAVADVKGKPDGETYFYMAKCFPMSPERVRFIVEVRRRSRNSFYQKRVIGLCLSRVASLRMKLPCTPTWCHGCN